MKGFKEENELKISVRMNKKCNKSSVLSVLYCNCPVANIAAESSFDLDLFCTVAKKWIAIMYTVVYFWMTFFRHYRVLHKYCWKYLMISCQFVVNRNFNSITIHLPNTLHLVSTCQALAQKWSRWDITGELDSVQKVIIA